MVGSKLAPGSRTWLALLFAGQPTEWPSVCLPLSVVLGERYSLGSGYGGYAIGVVVWSLHGTGTLVSPRGRSFF